MKIRLDGVRVALVSDTWVPQLNGVTRTLARLVAEARARGAEVRVFAPHDPGARPDPSVITFASRAFPPYPQLRVALPPARAFRRAWENWRPHLVHAATPFGVGLAARAAALQAGLPFVTSYHTSFGAYARFYRLGWLQRPGWQFLRWFHNSGRRTWCPTQAVADELAGHGFRQLAIWGRGVDTRAFSPQWRSLEFRRAHGIADGELLVTYVGRLAREKGIERLLHAARAVQSSGELPLRLMLVGDGPYEASCRAAAPAGTVFTGTLSGHALSAAFASADLFAFPSETDTFGNVVLEAMASGTPVLAADCPVMRELLCGEAGRFFDPADPRGLECSLRAVLQDPSGRTQLAARGLEQAVARGWDAVFDQLFADYRLAMVGGAVPAVMPGRSVVTPHVEMVAR